MLKRAWVVISILWAVAVISAAVRDIAGINASAVIFALFPVFLGAVIWVSSRYILRGSWPR